MSERIAAFNILSSFEKSKKRLDVLENRELSNSSLSADERRHVKNLTSGILRHKSLLDYYAALLYKGNFNKLNSAIIIILRMGFYEICFMEHVPVHASVNECVGLAKNIVGEKAGSLVNAILRSFLRQKDKLTTLTKPVSLKEISQQYSFPQWILERWQKYWGSEFTRDLCASFNQAPFFDVRINPLKTNADNFKKLLDKHELEYKESERFPGYFKIRQAGKINSAGFFSDGLCSVQDESAAIPVNMLSLKKTDTFLDLCAAPGGKFSQALETIPDISLAIAIDSDLSRLKRVKENLLRLGLKGFLIAADAVNLPLKIQFDKILLDAPCSGQGVIGKHPDIKWRRTLQEINIFSDLQKLLLNAAVKYLNPGGKIVYSTCSIDSKENEQVVESVMNENNMLSFYESPEMKSSSIKDLVKNHFIKTFPNQHEMDGSFACLLEKKRIKV